MPDYRGAKVAKLRGGGGGGLGVPDYKGFHYIPMHGSSS